MTNIGTGLKNENKISELLVSGSLAIYTKNSSGVHIFSGSSIDDGIISGKLTKPKYNNNELIKSIDTVIVELLPVEAPPIEDMVPRRIYNEALIRINTLTTEIQTLNTTILDLRAKVQELEIVSESLRVQLDLKDLTLASAQNQAGELTSKVGNSISELQNSIQKATAESIQRVSLYARNQSLQQELDALRLAVSAKEQALAAGAVSTGQIASILFDKGDPTKETTKQMIGMDYSGGGAASGKFAACGNEYQKTFRTYFEVIASSALTGTKDMTVDLKFTGRATESPWDFGVTFPFKLKSGETKRFEMKNPSAYWKKQGGQYDTGTWPFRTWHASEWDFTMSIIVTDGAGKTENKDFTFHIYKYG
jgi:hypothetical protein